MIYADAQNPASDGGLEISFVEVGRNCISIIVVHHRLEMSQASVHQVHLAMYADKQQYTTAGHTPLPGRAVANVSSIGNLLRNTTTKHPEAATAHTGGRCEQCKREKTYIDKYMRLILIQLLLVMVSSCKTQNTDIPKQMNQAINAEIALKFLNDYVSYLDIKNSNKDFLKWMDDNPLLTTNFKKSYRKIVEDAEKNDPELGLEFDPILDAQDNPSAFVIKNIDQNGYITLQGKDWTDFIVTVKLVKIDNKWLVEGSGIVNIPKDKQARR